MDVGGFLSTLTSDCLHCAAAIAMSCSSTTEGRDCGTCGLMFERNGGCLVLQSGQNLAPYLPAGCLSCVLELGMQCARPASEDEAPIELPQGTLCRECISSTCEEILGDTSGASMASFVDADCRSCATEILESCAVEEVEELEDFHCGNLNPAAGEYENCVAAFEHHGGCDRLLAGENPMHWLDGACKGCVAEAGMHCVLRRPEPERMRSVPDILRERGISKIFVVGLVYDFCVSETAIFGMEGLGLWADFEDGMNDAGIKVLTDLTRPSFDGKPGAPFTEGICDGSGGDPEQPSFCPEGGGTITAYERFKADMEASGVIVERRADLHSLRSDCR